MTGPRWTLVEDLFVRALDEPAAGRAEFVHRESGRDTELAKEVLSLLDNVREGATPLHEVVGAAITRLAESWTARTGVRIGAYRLEEKLGEGGMGIVYAASRDDAQFRQSVAIKILRHGLGSPSAIARFRDERQILATLEHPNIVRLLDGGSTDDDLPYIIMERVRGVSITTYAASRALPVAARLRLFTDVCAAVHYAHERGVVHRDLKPSNILVDDAGTAKLLDFSIARPIDGEIAREAHTRPGALLFTPEYASPEQARGESVGIASDVYSLGAVLYELLAGRPPYEGTPVDLLRKIGRESPPPPSVVAIDRRAEIGRDLDAIVAQTLDEDPARRYASAAALGDDLQRYLAGTAVAARGPAVWYRARKALRRRRAPLLAVSVAVAASAVGMGAWHRATSRSEVADDRCAPARERLAGVWDAASRDALAQHFAAAHSKKVDEAWIRIARELDDAAAKWAVRWDDACRAPDRRTDPLLYAQRMTCLEGVLFDLHGETLDLADMKPTDLTDLRSVGGGGIDGRVLEDCANTAVLRAQVPAPPPDQREHINALLVDAYRAARAVGAGARDPNGFDTAMARLDATTREIERIHPPAAAAPLLLRAMQIANNSWDVASRLRAARTAIEDARTRITATRDDIVLVGLELLAVKFELRLERDGDRIARASAALVRAEQALARAGYPLVLSVRVAIARGNLAATRGDDAAAIAAFRDAMARETDPDPMSSSALGYVMTSAYAGDTGAAIAELERRLPKVMARYGEDHAATRWMHNFFAMVLQLDGNYTGALAHYRAAIAIQSKAEKGPRLVWGKTYETELAVLAGAATDREVLDTVHHIAGLGTTPPHQSPDGIATVRRAGLFATFERAAELESDTGENEALDAAALLAFARGDDAELVRRMRAMTARCARAACDDWIRVSRWLEIIVDARAGRAHDVDARLDALEETYAGDHQAIANSGVVLASLGRWADARTRLARARAMPNVWERQSDLVEVDAWLGLALVHAGDLTAARTSFQEALDTLKAPENGLDGFTYMTPVAELGLAELLPVSERARARRRALRAQAGFARLGPHRNRDRDAAIRWLADHPSL
jgi:tetratricopeptide (TPR) repeat protein